MKNLGSKSLNIEKIIVLIWIFFISMNYQIIINFIYIFNKNILNIYCLYSVIDIYLLYLYQIQIKYY